MNQREYLRLKAEAEAEFRRKIEAIEMVWKLSGGSQNGSKPQENGIGKGSLQQAVRHALQFLSGEFTLRDVYSQIRASDPTFAEKIKDKLPSVSGALKRMADEKELVLVQAGSGKRPSKYRRAG